MSLDITFTARENIVCPKCGEVVVAKEVDSTYSGGRCWYEFLEHLGYYVPYEQRTEENDWYGKDMVLTKEQADELYRFVKANNDIYNASEIKGFIASAILDGNSVSINADW